MKKPTLTKETYTQSEVNELTQAYRDSLTTRDGREKIYSRSEVQRILDAIEANPKHRVGIGSRCHDDNND